MYMYQPWKIYFPPKISNLLKLVVHLFRQPLQMSGIVLSARGKGGGTASLKVGTHCQTTAPTFQHCPPPNLFLPPPILEGHRPPPPKIKHSQYKIFYKCDPKSSK